MAEPKSRTDQHEHVEAENRLHNEPVILYWGGVYMWEYLMQSSRCVIGWALEIYQPYICLVEGCSVGCTVSRWTACSWP